MISLRLEGVEEVLSCRETCLRASECLEGLRRYREHIEMGPMKETVSVHSRDGPVWGMCFNWGRASFASLMQHVRAALPRTIALSFQNKCVEVFTVKCRLMPTRVLLFGECLKFLNNVPLLFLQSLSVAQWHGCLALDHKVPSSSPTTVDLVMPFGRALTLIAPSLRWDVKLRHLIEVDFIGFHPDHFIFPHCHSLLGSYSRDTKYLACNW